MKSIFTLLFSLLILALEAQSNWPKEIKTKAGGVITIYQPQPEKLQGDKLIGRSAFSAKEKASDELVFGVFWYTAILTTNRDDRTATLGKITVTQVKLPGVDDENKINKLIALIETEIPKWDLTASLDDITSTIEEEQELASHNFKNDPPVIHFKTKASTLVLIDGEPKVQDDDKLKMKRVINTPFLIVQGKEDSKFYLYNGQFWYSSTFAGKDYIPASKLPKSIQPIDTELKKQESGKEKPKADSPPDVIISTTAAELIQSKGEAEFANIAGTPLLYVSNSNDDIFKSIDDQKFYVLISGRWYNAPILDGPWTFIAANQLPKDFSLIPEGSPKDNVLSSVPGTKASREAVMDAQIPQTAKVDRKTATCTVTYDGEPKFEKIEGTSLQLAMNTNSTVLQSGNAYYCVETGVWFVSTSPKGPWKVSDKRPEDVDKIPPTSPVYNTQYVYIYDSTPDVVYVGYTPGYMGCYVYGGVVVYGTGYYYNPWYGPYYYPHPVTYGFAMHYNPYCGWSVGFHMSFGWSPYHGGYWGPPMYRPPYYPPYHGGMYGGRGPTFINTGDINIDRSNNIYNNKNGVSTNDVKRGQNNPSAGTRDQNRNPGASQQPATGNSRNDVYGDKNGNVYQRKDNGDWNQRNGNQWKDASQPSNMNRDFENRQRSSTQNSSFQQSNRAGNMGGGARTGGGGGRRR